MRTTPLSKKLRKLTWVVVLAIALESNTTMVLRKSNGLKLLIMTTIQLRQLSPAKKPGKLRKAKKISETLLYHRGTAQKNLNRRSVAESRSQKSGKLMRH